jgi:hypothetical protein
MAGGLVVTAAVAGPTDSRPAGSLSAGPERHTGPQGRVGQFVAVCGYSHSAPDDPIVFPDRPGMSHRHDFYGAVGTDARSTADALARRRTTCDKPADTAAYWHPTLFDHDVAVRPREITAYYRAAPGVDPRSVRPLPFGLAMIAGDHAATAPPRDGATGWTCGSSTRLSDEPPDCPASAPLHLVLTFPDCWNGRDLDASDHRSHVAYSGRGRCPAGHPVVLPQLTVAIAFPVWGTGHALRLASGSVHSAHGDFLNAWDPEGLTREVEHCLHRDVVCEVASNRAEEALFQHT